MFAFSVDTKDLRAQGQAMHILQPHESIVSSQALLSWHIMQIA
jgi:hypothetical protein